MGVPSATAFTLHRPRADPRWGVPPRGHDAASIEAVASRRCEGRPASLAWATSFASPLAAARLPGRDQSEPSERHSTMTVNESAAAREHLAAARHLLDLRDAADVTFALLDCSSGDRRSIERFLDLTSSAASPVRLAQGLAALAVRLAECNGDAVRNAMLVAEVDLPSMPSERRTGASHVEVGAWLLLDDGVTAVTGRSVDHMGFVSLWLDDGDDPLRVHPCRQFTVLETNQTKGALK